MNRINLQLDAKSVIIGFLLALVAAMLFSGIPGRASQSEIRYMIAADENGIYIMENGGVRYIEKRKCAKPSGLRPDVSWGCNFYTQ